MAAADLKSLVSDARLVLEYAVRAGKLPDDSLAQAILALESSERASDIVALQNAMNAVAGAIAPMTLVDLRAGRNPFDARNVHARSRWQIGLAFATLGLIAFIAYYQYLVQRQEAALIAYKEVAEARASEKITDARDMVQLGNALTKDSCRRDAYIKARHDLKELARRTVMASTALYELSEASPWPFVDGMRDTAQWLKVSLQQAPPKPDFSAIGVQQKPLGAEIADPCDQNNRDKWIPAGYPSWLQNVVLDSFDEFCFASKLNVDQLAFDPVRRGNSYFGLGKPQDLVSTVEQRIRVQVGWLLPFLYGLLGACVYVMRRLLFDTNAAVVENVVVILRLALGALAGVAIGWFATPAVGVAAVAPISTLPYALAFMAGFSIDILFTILDRFNRLILEKTQPSAQQ